MCPRQGSPFSLLRQRKGTKRKATLVAGRPRADCSALLGLCGSGRTHYAACGRCVQTAARSQLLRRASARSRKALRCSARPKGERNTRLGSLRIGWVACLCLSGASIPQPERGECVRRPLHANRPLPTHTRPLQTPTCSLHTTTRYLHTTTRSG